MAMIGCHTPHLMDSSLDNPESSVLLSIAIIGEALVHSNRVLNGTKSVPHWSFPPLARELRTAGWCIGDITTMIKECDSSTLLYLSTLNQHTLGKNHERCSAEKGCQASVVDWTTYRTKHIDRCSQDHCDDIGPPVEEVGSILRDGDIPLIAVDTSTSPSQIEVIRYKERSEYRNDYVAISHVWSDGLGNPKANSLPRCQLERIQHLVNRLDSNETYLIPFWIDTICVPLAPELKSMAIAAMDKTYRNATNVLVLDKSWKNVTTAAPAIEIMMRIRYSTWMTRLWTYQEARLSRNLWFQLRDLPVDLDDVGDNIKPHKARQEVSDMLIEDKSQLHTHPNRLQLARALAYQNPKTQESLQKYAALPKQEREDEEAARLSAIQMLSEQRQGDPLRNFWYEIITEINPNSPLSDVDGDVSDNISRSLNQVASYAMSMRHLVRGTGGRETIGKLSPQAVVPGHRPAHHLIDVIRGIRGRTTSRLEDETICLSVLLGLDIGRVTQIPVIHWRWKDLLVKLREFLVYLGRLCPHQKFFHVFAESIGKLLRRSHEDRMKVFLSQFDFLSESMLFWDTPRLQGKGLGWAPSSFLSRNLDIDAPLKGGRRGHMTEEGLLVKCHAVGLHSPCLSYGPDEITRHSTGYDHLCIEWAMDNGALEDDRDSHSYEPNYELRKQNETALIWKWVRLHKTLRWPTRVFKDLDRKETAARLVILLEDDWLTTKKGALMHISKQQGQYCCVKHITTVRAIEQEPIRYAIRASGGWIARRAWCVG
ncbi:hypothetical protein MMC28_009917 [Mycoblastus sanguinarius]|nr:hypothetical protein [Mycoblastus sanguinarius]